jgi:uncharacterized protein (UPF0276 family)
MAPYEEDLRGPAPKPAIVDDVGIGLKAQHYHEILDTRPAVGWFEVHTENYMGAGGAPHHYLSTIRENYPISLHGVSLSLGGADPLDKDHLARTKSVIDRYEPALVSEHLAWTKLSGSHFNDLLPVPRTFEALETIANHIDEVQNFWGREILIENPSTYLEFAQNGMSEPEFLIALAQKSGCRLLVDVNNVYVSAKNNGFDATAWLSEISPHLVGEIHLAGHTVERIGQDEILIDDHGSEVSSVVWALYEAFIERIGLRPTLIEWDNNVPALSDWMIEASRAQTILSRKRAGYKEAEIANA